MPLTTETGEVNPGEATLAFAMTIASAIVGGLISGAVMGYAFSKGAGAAGGIPMRGGYGGSGRGMSGRSRRRY